MAENTIEKKIDRLFSCRDDHELTLCKRKICERTTTCKGDCSRCKIQFAYDALFQVIPERVYAD